MQLLPVATDRTYVELKSTCTFFILLALLLFCHGRTLGSEPLYGRLSAHLETTALNFSKRNRCHCIKLLGWLQSICRGHECHYECSTSENVYWVPVLTVSSSPSLPITTASTQTTSKAASYPRKEPGNAKDIALSQLWSGKAVDWTCVCSCKAQCTFHLVLLGVKGRWYNLADGGESHTSFLHSFSPQRTMKTVHVICPHFFCGRHGAHNLQEAGVRRLARPILLAFFRSRQRYTKLWKRELHCTFVTCW